MLAECLSPKKNSVPLVVVPLGGQTSAIPRRIPQEQQPDQGQSQIVLAPGNSLIALRAAGISEDLTGPPVGCPEPLPRRDDSGPQVLCRQTLGFKNRGSP